ncbi:ankyrin repeat domain-containing protein [Streptomyces luteogriseus]|uniref:ankyrin repeat domain-containing protein n=1 Tax=Streptomyces luteogriseus TaxID=68233 RepID=UPI00382702DA
MVNGERIVPKPRSLTDAVNAGMTRQVEELLEKGADPNDIREGIPPLHAAAAIGRRDIVEKLVLAGADVNRQDRFGRTPLHHAAIYGHKATVAYLLLRGANPGIRNRHGMLACDSAHLFKQDSLSTVLELALSADMQDARKLMRSIATTPRNQSDGADRRMIIALLQEKGINPVFEPLMRALLHEIRREKPQPQREPASHRSAHAGHSNLLPRRSFSPERAERFSGVPPESISLNPTWVIVGSDAAVLRDEVVNLEESGDYSAILDMAIRELRQIDLGEDVKAVDVFNQCLRRMEVTRGRRSEFHRTLESAIMLYTDDRFFRVLNSHWRSGRSKDLLGFSALMSMAFRHAAYFIQGDVFRGATLHDAEHYEPGLIFRWPFFVSASKEREVAANFGETVVTIEVPSSANVRDIDYCSIYPDEGEVLFRAYEAFEVIETSQEGVRIGVFDDDLFGTGLEVSERREITIIE